MPEFKVGDVVAVLEPCGIYQGFGTIAEIREDGSAKLTGDGREFRPVMFSDDLELPGVLAPWDDHLQRCTVIERLEDELSMESGKWVDLRRFTISQLERILAIVEEGEE